MAVIRPTGSLSASAFHVDPPLRPPPPGRYSGDHARQADAPPGAPAPHLPRVPPPARRSATAGSASTPAACHWRRSPQQQAGGSLPSPASSKMRREDISVHSLGLPNRLRVRPSSVLAHRRRPQSGSGSPPEQKHHRRIHSGSEPAKRSNGKLNDRMVNSGLAHRPSQAFRPGPLEKQKSPLLAKRALITFTRAGTSMVSRPSRLIVSGCRSRPLRS